jgi:ABC-type branched-subunit amino acid transport system substrate-binding protein
MGPLLVALACTPALLTTSAPAAVAGPAAACDRPSIGFMGPLTGSAAFIGKEQLGFARYAVRLLARDDVRLVETDTRLAPRRAAKLARELHADRNVLAVVGPAASREVLAVAPVFKQGDRLPFVSGSALSTPLTNGSIPSFFRVVPKESVQAPTLVALIRGRLKARQVVAVDDGTAYARRLAQDVEDRLRARGVSVRRASVRGGKADFPRVVALIPKRTGVVFMPWSVAGDAQLFGRELRRQGRRAAIVGSDGLDSADFKLPGSYVSAFAPDIRAVEGNDAFVRGYRDRFVSNFGPPVYVATQAAIVAVRRACVDGKATRAEVERFLRRTSIRRTVLGGRLRFTPRGDAAGSRFAIFRLGRDGEKTLVR